MTRLLFLVLLVLAPTALLAQPVGEVPPSVNDALVVLIGAVGIVAIPFLVWRVRQAVPRIPRVALPLITYGLGAVVAWLDSLVTGAQMTPVMVALIGLGAHAFREIVSTIDQHKGKA